MYIPTRTFHTLVTIFLTAACATAETFTGYGAAMPFITQEAESPDNATNGEVVRMPDGRQSHRTPAFEASGRAYVKLDRAGDYLEFKAPQDANALVVRFCIPDAPEGGGIEATLGLYLNGEKLHDLALSSKHIWLYGDRAPWDNGQSNTPAKYAHVFWDEARLLLNQPVAKGDTVRFQVDSNSTAEYYLIDLLELEWAPPPSPKPEDSLSVTDFGARGEDANVDTAALKACVRAAKEQGKTVWLPAGRFLQNEVIALSGVKVKGAGIWHTFLDGVVGDDSTTWHGNVGFQLLGIGSEVSGLSIDSPNMTYRKDGGKPFHGMAKDWLVEDVWITHTDVGFWMAGVNGTIRNCRVRMTYADGININNGLRFYTDGVLVENNHVRGVGDDGLAILCGTQENVDKPGLTRNVTLRNNTVVAPWWASTCDLAGGDGHIIEGNLLADSGGFIINMPGAYPMEALSDSVFRYNLIVRCGTSTQDERGAIWIYPATGPVSTMLVDNNIILDSQSHGIHFMGEQEQAIRFTNNRILNPARDGIHVARQVIGSGEFINNSLEGLADSYLALRNLAGDNYEVIAKGNSWQETE